MMHPDDDPYDPVDGSSQESFPASDSPAHTAVPARPAHPAPPEASDRAGVEHNEAMQRFEVRFPEGAAVLAYRYDTPTVLTLLHTEVPPALRGRGLAGSLAEAALGFARTRGLKVVPACPYVAAYLRKHPAFDDLIHTG